MSVQIKVEDVPVTFRTGLVVRTDKLQFPGYGSAFSVKGIIIGFDNNGKFATVVAERHSFDRLASGRRFNIEPWRLTPLHGNEEQQVRKNFDKFSDTELKRFGTSFKRLNANRHFDGRGGKQEKIL